MSYFAAAPASCQLCMLNAADRTFGWRRTLDATRVPHVLQPLVFGLINSGSVLACGACGKYARASEYLQLRDSVLERHQPIFDKGGAIARTHIPIMALSSFYRNFLELSNHTDKGKVIDLFAHAFPSTRAWYELIEKFSFDLDGFRFTSEDGDFVAWVDRNIFGLEQLASRNRGVGAGSRLLGQICQVADTHGAKIVGTVEPYQAFEQPPSLSRAQLHEWYARHGFRRIDDSHPDRIVREAVLP